MTIDLDLAREATPGRATLSPGWRRTFASLASLLFVVVLGGSVAPRPLLRVVASLPATTTDSFKLVADRVYVFGGGGQGAPAILHAYDLPGGRQRWQTTLPEKVDMFIPVQSAGILIVSMPSGKSTRIATIRASTGQVLWRMDGVFVKDMRSDTGVLTLSWTDPQVMQMVDLRSGTVRWSRNLALATKLTATGSGKLIVQSIDGLTQILNEDTGTVVATRQLPAVSSSAAPSDGLAVRDLVVVGTHLVVMDSYMASESISEYDLSTLASGWQVRLNMPVTPALDCAPRLCVGGQDNLTGQPNLTVLDPDTGAAVWRSNVWAWADPFGRWLLASTDSGHEQALLDPSTGQSLLDLSRWSPLSQPQSHVPILLTGPQAGRRGVWVGALDKDHLTVRPLAWLPDVVAHQCQLDQAGPAYLACGTWQGPVRVWRLGST